MFKEALKAGVFAAALALPGFALGQAAPAPDAKPAEAKAEEPKPSYTLTGNFGLFSQYIFRGLTQTNHNPAAQGGFDWAHESGFYLGTWASNISWLKEGFSTQAVTQGIYGSGGSMEWDFYGGYKWNLPNDFVIDLGGLYYWYPGKLNPNAIASNVPNNVPIADTFEIYLAPSWKWITFKGSYSVLNHTFGVDQSKGTYYLDLSANVPLGDVMSKSLEGFTLNLHGGYQKYKGTDPRNLVGGVIQSNDTVDSYKDAKVGLTYALPKDFSVGAFWSKAFSVNNAGYGGVFETPAGPYPSNLGKSTGTVFVQKTF